MSTHTQAIQRTFTGKVVSTKMDKTIVVSVNRTLVHPKYGKRYVQSKKYHVHDEKETAQVGDVVNFQECRPYSKTKRWRVVNTQA
ncbi:30S ribosomal protein S17 [Candidatus Uhrbacteria bacterium CG_4_9_14_3_um_filter_50_9]|uniref:Small ribosomal subunit protein uS17 n=1 Tax=Candidatus Uhrbacteria bacterium CG_4_9_14_3_um_filter_50_9 TaxID=1975035 RepID=A0A2M7XC41_9BACT|nr:MAG: 30S ribosomal protein S17 [Candidatus Uhrbacteria bacterium CG_4_9_14_3_um_filter_50_9]